MGAKCIHAYTVYLNVWQNTAYSANRRLQEEILDNTSNRTLKTTSAYLQELVEDFQAKLFDSVIRESDSKHKACINGWIAHLHTHFSPLFMGNGLSLWQQCDSNYMTKPPEIKNIKTSILLDIYIHTIKTVQISMKYSQLHIYRRHSKIVY